MNDDGSMLVAGFGSQSMSGALRRVLVRPPQPADGARWREYGWRAAPDHGRAAAEHEALRDLLEQAGAEVVVAAGEPGNPDAIYVYDPLLIGERGAVLLRPGKEARLGEAAALLDGLQTGRPIVERTRRDHPHDQEGEQEEHMVIARDHMLHAETEKLQERQGCWCGCNNVSQG